MQVLFGVYLVAIAAMVCLGIVAVMAKMKKQPIKSVDRIAALQRWEYLRSLEKDGKE